MNKMLLVHVVFLSVAGASAYAVWTSPAPTTSESETTPALLESDVLTAVRYRSGPKSLDIKVSGARESYAAVVTYAAPPTPEPSATEADAGTARSEESPDANAVEMKTFPGDKGLLRALDALAPLVPRRVIGAAEPEQLKKMGLDHSTTIDITAGGKTLSLELGNATYGGAANYALTTDGRVVLLESRAVKAFTLAAEQLMKRRLFDVDLENVAGLDVAVGERTASYLQQERTQRQKRYFARPDALSERVEEAQNVVTELRSLRVEKFVAPEALNAAKSVATFTIKLAEGDAVSGTLFETADGNATLLRQGPWVATLSLAAGRSLLEELTLAVPSGPAPAKD